MACVVTGVSVLVFDLDLLLSRACELLDVAALLGVRGLGVSGSSINFGGKSSSSSLYLRAFELRREPCARDSVGVTSVFGLFEKFGETSKSLCTA